MAARHLSQRLPSPSRGLSAILHVAGLSSFVASFRYLLITPNPINDSYGWHLQFLTIIGLTLSTLTFCLGLVADLTLSQQVFVLKNASALVSLPLEVLISLLYWSLRAVDPRLVVPEFAPAYAPSADVGFHVVPTLALLLDLLAFSPPWTITLLPAMALSSSIAVAYWFWVDHCYTQNGFYPYPLFDQVGNHGRLALFTASAVFMTAVALGLRTLYHRLNSGNRLHDRVNR